VADIVFAIPGDLDTPTGGYVYARQLLARLPLDGVALRHLALPGGYPHPAAADLAETARLFAATARESVLLIDGLAYGAMPKDLIEGFDRRIVALVHHPLGLEHGLSPERQADLLACEAEALALARHVIVTSPLTRRLLSADFDVPPEKITVAVPGTEPAARAVGTGSPVQILAVGAVSPRKGYDRLVAALAALKNLDWRATIAGATDRSPACVAALRRAIAASGLEDRIVLAGAVDDERLASLYAAADLVVSPSLFEGYGMVLAEALARGLPLVASTGGAAADTVPDAAAIKVTPGDSLALSAALRTMIVDAALRARLADGAWQAGQRLPRWPETAARVAGVLREVAR
jgi:glycosyltransferase involved in cell wall biosynthesis